MNIKKLRKSYYRLSTRTRLILYDAAESREDESEMGAILHASLTEKWTKPDFALQAEQLLKLRLIDLVLRLKYSREATFWFSLALGQEITGTAEADGQKDVQYLFDRAKLLAYFYCVSVDVADAVYKEMGLDAAGWKTREAELFDLDHEHEMTDRRMRDLAFDEHEAHAFVEKISREQGLENEIVLGFTYERKRAKFRKILKEVGFEQFFKT